jgi:glycosyltransferase involved in cell wall biosynthesis
MYQGGYLKRIAFAPVNNAYSGTEYMVHNFHKNIFPDMPKLNDYLAIVIPGISPNLENMLKWNGDIIVWLHNLVFQVDDALTQILRMPQFKAKIKFVICVSQSHKDYIVKEMDIEESKVVVLNNAIYPLNYNPSKFDSPKQVKLVHTSSPDRGMPILLEAIKYIDRDFRLEIYNEFNPDYYPEYTPDPRIKFFGRTPKATVLEAIESAHIHPYPAQYVETFCLSQVEAMSAGNLCVYPNIGSLPEVSNGFGISYDATENRENHIKLFADKLTEAIDMVADGNWHPEEQVNLINNKYSWDAIKKQWLDFHELL